MYPSALGHLELKYYNSCDVCFVSLASLYIDITVSLSPRDFVTTVGCLKWPKPNETDPDWLTIAKLLAQLNTAAI
jgi:hypothetical protein